MALSNRIIDILCCPVTKTPVTPVSKNMLKSLNNKIKEGNVVYVDDAIVNTPIEEALITENFSTVYCVVDGIPIMLEEKGISLDQNKLISVKEEFKPNKC